MTSAGQLFTNNAVALLAADITATDLTIQVQSGYGDLFPSPTMPHEFFLVTLENISAPINREIVKVISRFGDVFTIDPNGRGWEGTTAQVWAANDTLVDHRITAGTLRSMQGNFGESSNGISIPVNQTQAINILDVTQQNKTCKWIVTIQTADDRVAMTEVIAVYKSLPDQPKFIEYARVGDNITYSINVVGTATDMILELTNSDTVPFVQVDIIRLQHYT